MFIVDSQVHIWAASTPERPWPGRYEPHRPVPFSAEDLLREMDAAGVARVVIVPPGWEGDRNDLGLAAAQRYPERFAVMGRVDADAPDARAQVADWRRQPGMLGMRFTLRRPIFQAILKEGRLDWLWAEAEKHGVPVMLQVSHAQLPLVDRIAERFPGLRITLDHMALTNGEKDAVAFAGIDALIDIAKRANVAVKASGLPGYTDDVYPYRRLHPYLRRVYDAFGPRRMFWGTDLTRMPIGYPQLISMFTEEMPWLSAEDKAWIMGRGVCTWLGWPLPA